MYNEEIKREFLKTANANEQRYARKGFEYTEDWERTCGDDIYNFPLEDIVNYIVKNDRTSSLSLIDKFYMAIKSYKLWALRKGLIDSDALDTCVFNYADKTKFIEKVYLDNWKVPIFRTPGDLAVMLHSWFPITYETEITYETIAKVYMMLLYQGFTKDEIFSIKMDDIIVVPECVVIKAGTKVEVLYDEFEEDVLRLYNNRTFRSLVHKKEIVNLPIGEYFIGNGRKQTVNRLRALVNKFIATKTTKEYNMSMVIRSLYSMGQIYREKKYQDLYSNKNHVEQLIYELLCEKW